MIHTNNIVAFVAGSCWAHATIEAVEALAYIIGIQTNEFSVEEILECTTNDFPDIDSNSCGGGFPTFGLKHIISAGGLAYDQGVPYAAADVQEIGGITPNSINCYQVCTLKLLWLICCRTYKRQMKWPDTWDLCSQSSHPIVQRLLKT